MFSICRKRSLSLVLLVAAAAHALRPLPRPLRSDPTTSEAIIITHHANGLAHVLLNRPKAINALSTPMLQELLDLLDQAERPDESGVRCIAISGAGERGFCAGGDIKLVAALAEAGEQHDGLARRGEAGDEVVLGVRSCTRAQDYLRLEYAVDELLRRTEVPVVTVAHGLVYGGGQGLWAGAATFRVAAEDARLAMPEAVIGIVPDAGSTAFLRTHLRSRAQHLYVSLAGSAAALDAAALAERGLAGWLAPGGGAVAAAAVVTALAAAPPPPPGQRAWGDAAVAHALRGAGCAEVEVAGLRGVTEVEVEREIAREVERCFDEPCAAAAVHKLRAAVTRDGEGGEDSSEGGEGGEGGGGGGGRVGGAVAAWAAETAGAIEAGSPSALVCAAALVARVWADELPAEGGEGEGEGGGGGEGGEGGEDGEGGGAYAMRLRAALDAEYALNSALGLRTDFREGVACAVGVRRGEAPAWSPASLEEARRDPGLRAAIDAAGLSDWS